MEYQIKSVSWIREGKEQGKKYHFKDRSPFAHNLFNLLSLSPLLVGACLIISLGRWLSPFSYILIAVPLLGYFYFAFLVLIAHEAAHNYFILARDKKTRTWWNRFFGWATCVPFGMDYREVWEKGHALHHRYTARDQDGELCHPQTGSPLFRSAFKVLLVPGYILWFGISSGKGVYYDCPAGEKRRIHWKCLGAFLIFWTPVIYGLHILLKTEPWVNCVVIFSAGQVMAFLVVMRQALEHGIISQEENIYLRTRTTLGWAKHLLQPFNLSYHFEHHFFPAIPWYDLGRYHRDLKKTIPLELRPYLYTTGVHELWEQLRGRKPPLPGSLSDGLVLLTASK